MPHSPFSNLGRVRAQAHLGFGDLDEARRWAELGREEVTENDVYSRGTTSLVIAQVLEHQGRTSEAAEEYRQAVEQLQVAAEAFEIGLSNLAYGQFLISQMARETARTYLLQARDAFASLEAPSKVELIENLLSAV